jgi:hypothetical protein
VDEGMPLPKNEFHRGALYIEFDVIFPKPSELDQKARQNLAKILPPPAAGSLGPQPMDTQEKSNRPEGEKETVEDVVLVDVNIEEERAKFQQQQRGMISCNSCIDLFTTFSLIICCFLNDYRSTTTSSRGR